MSYSSYLLKVEGGMLLLAVKYGTACNYYVEQGIKKRGVGEGKQKQIHV